jgi:hypothetical protein
MLSRRAVSTEDELAGLRAEIAELRSWQASHICYPPPSPFYAQAFGNTMCAAPVPRSSVYLVNTAACGDQPVYQVGDLSAAGCAAGVPQVFTLTVPA